MLEIRKAEGVGYEYAIRSVLNALINDATRPREYVKKIPVIVQQGVELQAGELMLLKNEFGGPSRG